MSPMSPWIFEDQPCHPKSLRPWPSMPGARPMDFTGFIVRKCGELSIKNRGQLDILNTKKQHSNLWSGSPMPWPIPKWGDVLTSALTGRAQLACCFKNWVHVGPCFRRSNYCRKWFCSRIILYIKNIQEYLFDLTEGPWLPWFDPYWDQRKLTHSEIEGSYADAYVQQKTFTMQCLKDPH
jgi:hypothetical protein